jgi:hypothetical protein
VPVLTLREHSDACKIELKYMQPVLICMYPKPVLICMGPNVVVALVLYYIPRMKE